MSYWKFIYILCCQVSLKSLNSIFNCTHTFSEINTLRQIRQSIRMKYFALYKRSCVNGSWHTAVVELDYWKILHIPPLGHAPSPFESTSALWALLLWVPLNVLWMCLAFLNLWRWAWRKWGFQNLFVNLAGNFSLGWSKKTFTHIIYMSLNYCFKKRPIACGKNAKKPPQKQRWKSCPWTRKMPWQKLPLRKWIEMLPIVWKREIQREEEKE